MKRVLKVIGGFVAVIALVCVLGTSAQARTRVSFNIGFPLYFGSGYYSSGYCSPYAYSRPVYYCQRPAYRYYCAPPVYYYSGGCFYRR